MAQHDSTKLARMMERARALIARADHPNTPAPEAALAREQADKLIDKYRIEEAELIESGELRMTPSWRKFEVSPVRNEFARHYLNMLYDLVSHFDLSFRVDATETIRDSGLREAIYEADIVGYEADLTAFDLIFTEALSTFSKLVEPKFDPEKTEGENAYDLRRGGWTRARIAVQLYGLADDPAKQKGRNRRVTRLIKEQCERRGVSTDGLLGQGVNAKVYRDSFASAFQNEMSFRLMRVRQSRSESAVLVMKDHKERLREALYEKYPAMRPKPVVATLDGPSTYVPQGKCPKCQRAKSGRCREHRQYRARYAPVSEAGYRAGVSAAQTVNLGDTKRIS